MDKYIACQNYNRICGLISILTDMQLKTSMNSKACVLSDDMTTWTPTQINDYLYLKSLGDMINHLVTLRERTPWRPVEAKFNEGYL